MAGLLFFVAAIASCPHPAALLLALSAHECGHMATAALLGFGPPRVSLSPAGIRISYFGTAGVLPSLAVSLSGCLFGALLSLVSVLPADFRLYSGGLAALNLLPVSCLDGGGALLTVLEAFLLPHTAYRVARAVSAVFTVLFFALAAAVQLKAGVNVSLLCVCVYLTVLLPTDGR